MSRTVVFIVCILFTNLLSAQGDSYKDSIEAYFKKYVKEHEVVKGKDKELITFFPANEKYVIRCSFERTINAPWFRMESSGPVKRNYRVYGKIHFTINDTSVTLNIYQSQELMVTEQYRDHLFIPFTDATSGF